MSNGMFSRMRRWERIKANPQKLEKHREINRKSVKKYREKKRIIKLEAQSGKTQHKCR